MGYQRKLRDCLLHFANGGQALAHEKEKDEQYKTMAEYPLALTARVMTNSRQFKIFPFAPYVNFGTNKTCDLAMT